jgi:hypothetical protein
VKLIRTCKPKPVRARVSELVLFFVVLFEVTGHG